MKHMWSEEEISSQKKDIATLVDSKGNPRFVEGEGTPTAIEGFTSTYCKWSLSGTHLMLVLAGSIANGTTITGEMASFTLPNYIKDKIQPLTGDYIELKAVVMRAGNLTTQQVEFQNRITSTGVKITSSNLTLSADRFFRVQFDLLIDSE